MWTGLQPIRPEDWFTKALLGTVEKLNEGIQTLVADRAQLDQTLARLRAADPATVDVTNLVGFPAFAVTRCDVLQRELAVRRQVAEFWTKYFDALPLAARKAAENHRETERRLSEAMEALGFVMRGPDRLRWAPGVIASHPGVRQAREHAGRLSNALNDHARQSANAQAVETISAQIRQAIAGGLPK